MRLTLTWASRGRASFHSRARYRRTDACLLTIYDLLLTSLPIELSHRDGLFDASQHLSETGISVLRTSIVLPSGWAELSRLFRLHYASDLPFIHLPTLVEPYITAAHHHWFSNGNAHAPNTTQIPLPGSCGLILAFLALTLRHCRSRIREYLVPHAQDLDNATALSAYFVVLAKRRLSSNDTDWSVTDVGGVQVRLMLAAYDWSLGRSQQARLLLSEAASLAGDIGLLPDHRAKRASSSISVAMAYEAESMGLRLRSKGGNEDQLDHADHPEVARRTTWSLFLLDTEYALGHHRSKLISSTDNFPPLPNDEATFAASAPPINISPDSECGTGWLGRSMQGLGMSQPQLGSYFPASSSTDFWPPLTPSISSTSSNSVPGSTDDKDLCYYIHYVSLFHRIHVWAHSTPWRFVSFVFWGWSLLIR